MPDLTPELFAELWRSARAGQAHADPDLAAFQKFMVMHEDLHELLDRFAADPSTPLEAHGENVMMHIAMDAATERSLGSNRPPGIVDVFGLLVQGGFDQGDAFHVLAQAMQHEAAAVSESGKDFDPAAYLARATAYAQQAIKSRGG